jgi:hypothetical protein
MEVEDHLEFLILGLGVDCEGFRPLCPGTFPDAEHIGISLIRPWSRNREVCSSKLSQCYDVAMSH